MPGTGEHDHASADRHHEEPLLAGERDVALASASACYAAWSKAPAAP